MQYYNTRFKWSFSYIGLSWNNIAQLKTQMCLFVTGLLVSRSYWTFHSRRCLIVCQVQQRVHNHRVAPTICQSPTSIIISSINYRENQRLWFCSLIQRHQCWCLPASSLLQTKVVSAILKPSGQYLWRPKGAVAGIESELASRREPEY